MSLNSINKLLINNILWIIFSFLTIALYLSPLVMNNGVFYTPVFDNLDSNVIWYKILAESGMIFADNNAIIPNMMSGLPRSSYPGEFNIILWLYYFFTPQTAYVINEILIHIVAFLSMYIFLKRYIVQPNVYYCNVPIFVGALYFSLIPYWSGAGLTVAILPLVTYSLLNIKNGISSKWDWILLIFLPLYTHFIFLYMFYIIMASIYMLYDTLKNHQLNIRFFTALFLMGTLFLLSEYRLVLAMFTDSGFVSHRTEFNIFFTKNFMESYRIAHTFFLDGHLSHIRSLQKFYLLPIVLISMLLVFSNRKYTIKESFVIWILVTLSFVLDLWSILLTNIYTLPVLMISSIILIFLKKNHSKSIGYLVLLQIILAFIASMEHYEGIKDIVSVIPILNKLNFIRIAFVQPFVWGILIVIASLVFYRKLHLTSFFLFIFLFLQMDVSFKTSFYQKSPTEKYASFQDFYAPQLFDKVKKSISEPLHTIKIVSYGFEPAVSLYNGFYTIDGYIVNYPLQYKHDFRTVIGEYLDRKENIEAKKLFDNWGGKLYILSTLISLQFYDKNIIVEKLDFNSNALCNLNVNYLLSSRKLKLPNDKNLTYIDYFHGNKSSWDIYLYHLECTNSNNKRNFLN